MNMIRVVYLMAFGPPYIKFTFSLKTDLESVRFVCSWLFGTFTATSNCK